MPNKKQWLGCQREFVITDKYRKKLSISWGKPCIYLCNDDQDPRMHCSHLELAFFEENCIFVNIYNNKFY